MPLVADGLGLVRRLAEATPAERLAYLATLTDMEKAEALYAWELWARQDQLPPGDDWGTWVLLSGRGAGKTRAGAEWVRAHVEDGTYGRLALVAPTAADARDVMVEGDSGVLAISRDWWRPHYEPSKRRLTWPNGAMATLYSADEPERLRGPQHDAAWCDELGSWRYPDAWDMLQFGLRLGPAPRAVVTTTPRPTRLMRRVLEHPRTVQTHATTLDNRAYLAPSFFDAILHTYGGTRLGRQEIMGELLDDVQGALWSLAMLDASHLPADALQPRNGDGPLVQLVRIVVAVDPAVTSGEDADETGIIVAGLGPPPGEPAGPPEHGYVLEDATCRLPPGEWAQRVVGLYHKWEADRVVAEVNNGGDLVEHLLRTVDRSVSYRKVTASRGKRVRAEPVAALYEQGRVHHVGDLSALEDQQRNFVPDVTSEQSPDHVDALVWAMTDLIVARRYRPAAVHRQG
jgi:phage terminase large subunit-like protein